MKTCPKCGYERQLSDLNAPDWACPACGLVYAKYDPSALPAARPPRPAEERVAPAALRWGRWVEGALIAAMIGWAALGYLGLLSVRLYFGISLVFPWLAPALVLWQPRMFTFRIRGDSNKDTLRLASVMPLVLVPTMLLFFGAGALWELDDVLALVPLAVGGGLLLTALFALMSRELRRSWLLAGAFAVQAIFYAGGAATYANGVLDGSAGEVYTLHILSKKHDEDGYYLITTAPGADDGWTKLNVSARVYERKKKGDIICTVRHRGYFGMPWSWQRDCGSQEAAAQAVDRVSALKKYGMDYAMEIYELNELTDARLQVMKRVDEHLATLAGTESRETIRMLVRSAYRKEGFAFDPEGAD